MSRGPDPREPRPGDSIQRRDIDAFPSSGGANFPDRNPTIAPSAQSRTQPHRAPRPSKSREVYEIRGRTYRLRDSEVRAMTDVGKFRALAQEDLIEFFYAGAKDHFRADFENLVRQGLVELKSIPHEDHGHRTLLTLTKQGHRFLTQTQATQKGQVLYHGFAKPREAHHDADLYRLYQKAAEKIERDGGKNLRVVLDYEMKKRVYHDLAKLGKDRDDPAHKRAVAERHALKMVRGKIPIPDVRVEYETRDGESARIDLELATGHYRLRNLVTKVLAGFSVFAHGDEVSKLRKVLDQRELTAEILSL
jgi:hypothetical protein